MSSRCNLVITENGETTLYYDRGYANILDKIVFWGPEYTKAFILERDANPEGLLDSIWSDGGVVLDFDTQCLTWFGGEEIEFDAGYNLILHELIKHQWSNWKIIWAKAGIYDIARAAGISLKKVRPRRHIQPHELTQYYTKSGYLYADGIVSINLEEGRTSFFITTGWLTSIAHSDVNLRSIQYNIETFNYDEFLACRKIDSYKNLLWGAHFDCAKRELDVWHSEKVSELRDLLESHWTGWRISDHGVDFKWHLDHIPKGHMQETDNFKRQHILKELRDSIRKEQENPIVSEHRTGSLGAERKLEIINRLIAKYALRLVHITD